MNLGWGEWLVIVAIVLLLFGAKKLPELGRSLGEAIREFQQSLKNKDLNDQQPPEKP
jgi:sec-independent protein translocase protein TatA